MKKLRLAICLAAMAVLGGCVSGGTDVTPEQAAAFVPGKSTEQEVIAKLGPANATKTSTDGATSLTYAHTAAHATAASYIPVVGIFAGGAKGTSNAVTFHFDPHGVLKDKESTTSAVNVHNF